jgi:hypothetical protein
MDHHICRLQKVSFRVNSLSRLKLKADAFYRITSQEKNEI